MHTYDPFDTSMTSMRDDYTEQVTSGISAPSFNINAKYTLLNRQRMPDILAV